MNKNVSFGLIIGSLIGLGMTFQMAEDTMNRDLDWAIEANLLDYVNPVAVFFCASALTLSLISWLLYYRKERHECLKSPLTKPQ